MEIESKIKENTSKNIIKIKNKKICARCKQPIFLVPLDFSGIPKKKFCQSCWSVIYTVYKGLKYLEEESSLLNFVLKINGR